MSVIILHQDLRMKGMGSRRSDLNFHINKLKDWIKESRYPKELLKKNREQGLEISISASIDNLKRKFKRDIFNCNK